MGDGVEGRRKDFLLWEHFPCPLTPVPERAFMTYQHPGLQVQPQIPSHVCSVLLTAFWGTGLASCEESTHIFDI